jgi:hypothetical protein
MGYINGIQGMGGREMAIEQGENIAWDLACGRGKSYGARPHARICMCGALA